MKKILFLSWFLLFSFGVFGQSILHVNNSNDGTYRDYTDLQEAIDSAVEGSTIYVHPTGGSWNGYGSITITKKLNIYGGGYKIAEGQVLNTTKHSSYISSIGINAGAEGSLFRGLEFGGIGLNADNVKIQYCSAGNINLRGQRCQINNSYINNSFSDRALNIYSTARDGIFRNNIFDTQIYCWDDYADGFIFENNTFANYAGGSVGFVASEFTNNIFLGGLNCRDCQGLVNHNIFDIDYASTYGTNNLYSIDESTIFVGYPTQGYYSFDIRFQLKSDSPAKGYGVDGVDCGAYGGTTPYVPSGIAELPVIYELTAPETAPLNGKLNVTVKARSGN